MHRILLFLSLFIILVAPAGLEAQSGRPLDITVNFPPPFPREFTAYFNNPTAYSITVTNFSDQDQEVYFLAEMRGLTNSVLVQTRREYRSMAPLMIGAGETIMLTGEDVANLNEGIQLSDLNISGLPGGPSINGILPEGMYQFCINAYDFGLEAVTPLSVGCGTLIDITYADQLTILNPSEDDVLLANPGGTFEMMWDPNESDPMRRMDIEYEVKMIDLTEYPDEDLDILLRDGGPQVEFDEDMIMTEFYLYGATGTDFELEFGHQYAMRVRRVDADPVPLINDGYSEIRTFWYGEIPEPELADEEVETPPNITDCVANCEYTEDLNQTRKTNTSGLDSLLIGHFTMKDVVFTGPTTGPTWRGTGTINLGGWMLGYPLAVTFSNLVINEDNRVIGGLVKARDDSNDEYDLGDLHQRLDAVAGYVPDTIASVVNEHVLSLRMLDGLLTGDAQGMPVGIEEEIQGHKFTFALVGAIFTARGADVDLMTLIDLTSLSPNLLLPLSSRGVCLTPGGLGSEATLLLTEEIGTDLGTEMAISLKGSPRSNMTRAKNNACYIEFDCDGIKELAIRGKVEFPRSMVVPDNDGAVVDTGRVNGLFEFTLDRNVPDSLSAYAYRTPEPAPGQPALTEPPGGSHIMMGYEMTPFQIAGLEGWTFTVRDATLDLSELENPAGMKFPKDYAYSENVDTGELWQGFLLKELSLATPRTMRADSQRSRVTISNIIIDPEPSISMNALVLNLIDKSVGAMDSWGFSLDTFQLSIVQNTLIDGRIMGKISTPLVGSADYLKYKAIINRNDEEKYEFNAIATPEKDSIVNLPMVVAKAGICPNSFIQFRTTPDTTHLQAFLAGQMSVNVTENLPDSLQAMGLVPELSIKFAQFQLNFDNKNGFVTAGEAPIGTESMFGFAVDFQDELCGTNYNGPIFADTDQPDYDYDLDDIDSLLNPSAPTVAADTSNQNAPQEKMSGFPITIGNVDFNFAGERVGLELDINLHLNGSENHELKGSARVGVASTLRREGLKIKKFRVDSVYLSAVTVGTEEDPIDLDFMSMYGGVKFVNFSGGKGFQGELHLQTKSDMGFDLKAGFGKAGNSESGAYGTEAYHGWWYLDGMFKFPGTGIPLGPVASMHGIGGGVYWNCTAPSLTLSVAEVMAAADGASQLEQAENPVPSFRERTIAFRTNMSLVRQSIMVVEPEIVASWTAGEGLNSLSLNGDFWSLAVNLTNNTDSEWYKTSARLWGETRNTLLIERADDTRKFAVMGTNRIYANLINNVLYGAGDSMRMVQSAFYIGHKDLVADYDVGNINGNTYWFLNIGNPYAGNMGGLAFNLPGFNLDLGGEERENLGEGRPTASVGAGVDFYLMAGMNVPSTLPPPPGRITELFGLINGEGESEPGNGMEATVQEDERDASATSNLTGLGFVVGAHAFASAEVNAILYARLTILAGLDFMAFQYPEGTGCITESGEEIPEIGINGWYGTGRAYVGIEGILGARGRFMGNQIDVRIMHLVAAAMVEAGGPRPMYLNGRLGIYYSLLGGLIEGRARMKINVGQRCRPIGGSPFGIPLIVQTEPTGEGEASALIHPKVSFSVPLVKDKDVPEYDKIIRVPDTEGNVRSLMAYVHEFSITPRGGGSRADYERDETTPMLIQDGRAAEYRPVSYISAPYGVEQSRNWRMRIVLRAKEKLSNGRWTDVPGVGNSLFEEVREVDFTTGPLPEQLQESQVGMTKPLRFQQFYLQDDSGRKRAIVHTRQQEENTYFAPTNYDGNTDYTYSGVIVDAETQAEIRRVPVDYRPGVRRAVFDLPTLANGREFQLMIIRTSSSQLAPGQQLVRRQTIARVGTDDAYAAEAINSQYTINADVVDLRRAINLDPTELMLYSWSFRTSEHNTLAEKMEVTQLTSYQQNGYQRIRIHGGFEGFDHYDMYGKAYRFGTTTPDENRFVAPALVRVADPFISPFHEEQSRPLLGGFVTDYYEDYSGEPTGIFARFTDQLQVPSQGLPNGLPGTQGSGLPGNNGGGSSTTFIAGPGDVEMDWPIHPRHDAVLNFNWTQNNMNAELNDRIASNQLFENTEDGLANPPANPDIYFRYYITEKILADAEELTDFYEYWRDRILRPEDHVENPMEVDQFVNISLPDFRRENLEELDVRYLDLVNSQLVRTPPVTILTLADYDDSPGGGFNGGTVTYGNTSIGGLTNGTNVTRLNAGANWNNNQNNNPDIEYTTAAERYRSRNRANRYGFSNQLKFFASYPDLGSGRTTKVLPLNN